MHVASVHCKDGDWPPKGVPGALGEEKPLGQGSVGMGRFIGKLKAIGFKGPLNIEREVPDPAQRLSDIAMGVKLLETARQLGICLADPLPLNAFVAPPGTQVLEFFRPAAGPVNHQPVGSVALSHSERERQLGLGKVA
jgi:hypothetical protein